MRASPKPWTTADQRRLVSFRRLGFSQRSIAQVLGRSIASVYERAKLLDCPRRCRRWTAADDALVRDEDVPAAQVARALGRSVGAVWTRRYRLRRLYE